MKKGLELEEIVLLGRTLDEYHHMFDLSDAQMGCGKILDVASGVSSFCAEATEKGFEVTASDAIYGMHSDEIERRCRSDLQEVVRQLPEIADAYIWKYFANVRALEVARETAYKRFLNDYASCGEETYRKVEYPISHFADGEFALALVSHFLFLYDDRLDYSFHLAVLRELARITSKEIRLFPLVNFEGERSPFVGRLMNEEEFGAYRFSIRPVEYEFLKNANEVLVIDLSR